MRSILVVLIAITFASAPLQARAGVDLDAAVKSLAAVPADAAGDVIGGGGLMASAVAGLAGDIVGAIDNNTYSHVVLRGLLSTPLRRLALGMSGMSSGILEGFSNDDYAEYPQSSATYMSMNLENRVGTFGDGVGAVVLGVVDTVGNLGGFLLNLPGLNEQAADLAKMQSDMRGTLVGAATDGAYAPGTLKLD